jgi:PQQ-like domain
MSVVFPSTGRFAGQPEPFNPSRLKVAPTAFYRTFGGKNYDATTDIAKLKTGGFVVTGRTNSYGASSADMNVSVVKLDNTGNVLWDRNFGGNETDEGMSVCEAKDGGILVAGTSDSFGGGPDMKDIWLLKLDKDGKKMWDKVLGGNESIDEARDIAQLEDGSIIVLGNSIKMSTGKSDAVLLKLSEKGDLVWKRNFGTEPGNEEASHLIRTKEGGFVLAGNKEVNQNKVWNFWIIGVDKDGYKLWEQTCGGKQNDRANALAATPDGGYVLTGYTYSYAEGSHDMWVVKVDAKGQKQWDKVFGGPSTDEALDVVVGKNGQVLVVGYMDVFVPDDNGENTSKDGNDVFALMLDASGKEMWKKNVGGAGAQRAYSVVEDADGTFILAGYSEADNTDHLVLKVSASGQVGK